MFGQKISTIRQSLQMRASAGAKSHATRDSATGNIVQYSIDVQLSDNNKKMLQAFKHSSGFYNVSPKKNKGNNSSPQKQQPIQQQPAPQPIHVSPIDSAQCPRIYLFGNNLKKSTISSKIQPKTSTPPPLNLNATLQSKSTTPFPLTLTATKQSTAHANATSTSSYYNNNNNTSTPLNLTINNNSVNNQKHKQFLYEIFETLGFMQGHAGMASKMQFCDVMDVAYAKFIDMNSTGRWDLIKKYFKPNNEQEQDNCNFAATRSIIKKRSMIDTAQIQQKKKVKVIQPQTASQLIRTKYKLTQQFQKNINKVTKGFIFQKYCYNKQKIQQIKVYLSYDMKCICWQSNDNSNNNNNLINNIINKSPVVQNMQNYNGITDGPRSKNYQKYMVKQYKIDQQLAFSLVLKNRTLDLMAESIQQKQEFIQCIKFAKNFA